MVYLMTATLCAQRDTPAAVAHEPTSPLMQPSVSNDNDHLIISASAYNGRFW